MSWEFKGYDRFDPNLYCGDCDEGHCSRYPFASYDADGDLMEYVNTPEDGNQAEAHWYKKAGTEDTMATQPYRYMEFPCCFTATISDVDNSDMDVSWCADCPELNGSYNDSMSSLTFWLCDLSDLYDTSSPNGNNSQQSWTAPCHVYRLDVDIYLDTSEPPNIIGEAKLLADNTTYFQHYPYDELDGNFLGERTVVQWRKHLGVYDGDYIVSGNRSYPAGVFPPYYGDYGTLDGREFSVVFSASDLYDPESGPVPLLSGLCDFSGVTIHIAPRDNSDTLSRLCQDSLPVTYGQGYYASNFYSYYPLAYPYCTGAYLYNGCYGLDGESARSISNTITATISGVTSPDDLLDDDELTYQTCQKCTNLNNAFDLVHGNLTIDHQLTKGVGWRFGDGDEHVPDTCCECPNSMMCIDDVHVYFDYEQVGGGSINPTLEISLKAEIEHSTHGTVATFKKVIDTIEYTLQSGYRVCDCNALNMDLDFVSQTSLGDYQRCDFSEASVNIQTKSYDDLQSTCSKRTYRCSYCYGKDRPRYVKAIFPTDGWTNNLYDADYSACEDLQLFEGEYLLDNLCLAPTKSVWTNDGVSCSWLYYLEDTNAPGMPYLIGGGPDECWPSCNPSRSISLSISSWAGQGEPFRDFKVVLGVWVAIAGGQCPNSCGFSWTGYADGKRGSGVPLRTSEPHNVWGGVYMDCEVELNGLVLEYDEGNYCPRQNNYQIPPDWRYAQYWEWNGSSVTLSMDY